MKRRIAASAAGIALVFVSLGTTPASASEQAVGGANDANTASQTSVKASGCVLKLRKPYKKSKIKTAITYGKASGCNKITSLAVTLQRHRWYGWQNLNTAKWDGNGKRYAGATCSGTYTYRAWGSVSVPLGGGKYQTGTSHSPSKRFSC